MLNQPSVKRTLLIKTLLLLLVGFISATYAVDTMSMVKLRRMSGTTGWKNININKSCSGGELIIDGKKFKNGIGVHSLSSLIYAIPKGAKSFTVIGGLDDGGSKRGSVVLSISAGPDISYFTELEKSPKLTGSGKLFYGFSVKLPKNAEVIQLTVADGGDGNGHDHVDWINPIFHGKKLKARKVKITHIDNPLRPKGPLPYWNDVSVVEVNRMAPRAHFIAYPTKNAAKEGGNTTLRKSLNGTWKFHWCDTPNNRPKDFYKTEFNTIAWDDIKVPLNWQMAGFGIPLYNNSIFTFNSKTPYIDQIFNPVGSYKRTFTIPVNWQKRQTLISFAGVDSAFTLWINGKEVGYSEGSRAGAEFDITKYLKKGQNDLAAEVIRFSSGSWLEDQDFFRLSGIFRDVDLISRPAGQRLRDFTLRTPLDKNYVNANLELEFETENADGGEIKVEISDASGKVIQSIKTSINDNIAKVNKLITRPKLWSAETPYLYTLTITHSNKSGKVIEVVPWRFGFRWSEMKNNRLYVNGKPIIIAGVNRHEHSSIGGHYVTREELIRDIVTMKRLNFNAVRTCHYPNHTDLYAICDEYGMYVNDEANIESHGDQGIPRKPEFAESHHHRMQRMVERDKNFTSVITWSLGNESGSHGAHDDNYNWTKENDYRPIGYQRHGGGACTDYNSAFYAPPSWVASYGKNSKIKTLIKSEYAHTMGNSSGNLKEYWDAYWQDNNAQGGFVWDWMDQGLAMPVPERAWVKIPSVDADFLMIEGEQPNKNGLRGILYFGHGSEPALQAPWTVQMMLRTAPKTTDTLGFYPLFSKNSETGAIFLERNQIVFQSFGIDRNKLMVKLPASFFDGGEHSLTVTQHGKVVSFYCDGKKIGMIPMKHPLRNSRAGFLAFGSGVGTPLVRKQLISSAPTMLTAKLVAGAYEPATIKGQKTLVDIDFCKDIKVKNKKEANGIFFAYGGYFDNRRGHYTPENFCMNGVVNTVCQPHPGAYAFKYVQQPFETKMVDKTNGKFTIFNRNFFKALDSDYAVTWELTEDGFIIQKGKLAITIEPRKLLTIEMPTKPFTKKAGKEYRFNIRYHLAKSTCWAKSGHIIGWEQFNLGYNPEPSKFSGASLKFTTNGDISSITGNNFSVAFSEKIGTLVSYKMAGKKLLTGGLLPDFWRGMTDNDKPAFRLKGTRWRDTSLKNATLTHSIIAENHHRLAITATIAPNGSKVALNFDVHGDGNVEVEFKLTEVKPLPLRGKRKPVDYLLRFGLRAPVAKDMTKIEWYGHGPREAYCDRNYDIIGRYSNTVDGMFTDYARPQESGNIHGVRKAFLSNGKGKGLEIIATPTTPLNISARRLPHQILEAVKYTYQLPPSDAVYLNIDHKVMGIGGNDTWGAKPLGQYQLHAKPMSYKFIIRGRTK